MSRPGARSHTTRASAPRKSTLDGAGTMRWALLVAAAAAAPDLLFFSDLFELQ